MTLAAVVKVGGGLSVFPGALARVGQAIGKAAERHRILVVPGGGPFAQSVREFDKRFELDPSAAHWMAILAMDQYAHVLAQCIHRATIMEEPADLPALLDAGSVSILAPSRWLRASDPLPHTWDVTSDSLAAWIAGALDAERLVLVKPASGPVKTVVDPYFAKVLPLEMPCIVLGPDEVDRLSAILDERDGAPAV